MDDKLDALVRAASQMPKPPPMDGPDEFDPSKVRCACEKMVDASKMPIYNTGVIDAIDIVCPGCAGMDDGLSRVVCCKCKIVVMWIKPHTDKHGFRFIAGHTYHTATCPKCQPGVEKTEILEKVIFYKGNNIPYDGG